MTDVQVTFQSRHDLEESVKDPEESVKDLGARP